MKFTWAQSLVEMDLPEALQPYYYKTLHHRYWGREYHLACSQELFSAAQVDRGSLLLLQSLLPQEKIQDKGQSKDRGVLQTIVGDALADGVLAIWDWGCGIGTLGILAQGYASQIAEKYHKQREEPLRCELRIFDRDSLALAFAEANWHANRSAGPSFSPDLQVATGIWGEEAMDSPHRQLVLCNIPAKLGEPVLRQVLPALASGSRSYVVLVIVAPLRHLLEEATQAGEIEILLRTGSGDHCVYHYRQSGELLLPQALEPLELYRRSESCFTVERRGRAFHWGTNPPMPSSKNQAMEGTKNQATGLKKWPVRWNFHSAYGLPDFDHPSHALQLQVRILGQRNWGGRILLWQPGHGHLACFLACKPGSQIRHIDLAGRNRLELLFAQENITNLEGPSTEIHASPCLEALAISSLDSLHPIAPKPPAASLIVLPLNEKRKSTLPLQHWLSLLPRSTWLCLQGKSAALSQLQQLPAWTRNSEIRGHGLLTQLWHKESPSSFLA